MRIALAMFAASAACGDDDEGKKLPLVDPAAWRPATATEDPFRDERPSEIDCPSSAYHELMGGNGGLEVTTGLCNYLSVIQPTVEEVGAGKEINLVVFHPGLYQPGEAHVAVTLDGAIVWEKRIDLPVDAAVYEHHVASEQRFPAGTPVVFHLHNHGINDWAFTEFTVTP